MFIYQLEIHSQGITTNILQSSFYGGNSDEATTSLAYDSTGDLLVMTGTTLSSNFPIVSPFPFNQTLGGNDGFFVVLRISGLSCHDSFLTVKDNTVVMSNRFGGSAFDSVFRIAMGPDNNVYFCGITISTDMLTFGTLRLCSSCSPQGSPPFLSSFQGVQDTFVGMLNLTSCKCLCHDMWHLQVTIEYSSYWGGNRNDVPTQIAVDKYDKSIYVVGNTQSTNFPTINAEFPTLIGSQAGYISCFTPNFRKKIQSICCL